MTAFANGVKITLPTIKLPSARWPAPYKIRGHIVVVVVYFITSCCAHVNMAHGYGNRCCHRPVVAGVRYINAPLEVIVYIIIAVVDITRSIVIMMHYHGPVTTITVVVMNVHVAPPVIMLVITIPVVVMVSSVVAVTVMMIPPVIVMPFMLIIMASVSSPLRHCIH